MSNSASTQPPASKESADNDTVSQLIWQLKSTFRPTDFEKVQQILNAREEAMRRDISYWKREYESMEKRHVEIALEKLISDDELGKCRRERDLLKDQVARAEMDQRVQIARLEEDQRVRMARFKEDQKVNKERDKHWEERYGKLWEDFTKVETEKTKWSYTVSSLNFEKQKAERELESCKKRFEELSQRISRLEDDTAMLMSGGPAVEDRREEVVAVAEMTVAADELVMDVKEARKGNGTGNENLPEPLVKESPSNCYEKADSLPGGGSAPDAMEVGRPMAIIEISDDEMPTRKRCSCSDDAEDDVKPINKRQTKSIEELIKDIPDGSESSDTGDSSSSGSDIDVNIEIARLCRKVAENKPWASKVDMISALKREPELCMNAVCALYRKQLCEVERSIGSSVSKNKVFNQFDALRGTRLGKYLTDGDPQRKLKRSVSELQEFDPNGLADCRKLAINYSDQLFEIYREKQDAFFVRL